MVWFVKLLFGALILLGGGHLFGLLRLFRRFRAHGEHV
jgi:hypothetical protein